MVKIAKHPHEDLVEFLQETLEEKLRDVVLSDTSGREILFTRDDIDGQFISDDMQPDHQRAVTPFSGRDAESMVTAHNGKLDCIVGMTETVVVIFLYPVDKAGIRISFDRSHNLTLQPFVEECLAIVR